ncbi:copper chaperone PCu(A)C (plasmid) [Rhizobium sp. TRM96647]|uniref:copper chaperone PCu(A)C n=1 Tax=unclassified Rhizobium TaxID=2613769 RepID=UPI0021E7F6A5|nr:MULTISPECIES: copper chaperone PCu(A)C [unclassified Rhizobium]MCV3735594.1 copper chaperone PCu(A)C [Rhizobium sp. TRM96647]MCV3757643.1 copper chaperone PCu(A)C [Rhizobium sp. TRM96650]
MKRLFNILSAALLLLAPLLLAPTFGAARDYKAGSIEILQPVAKATMPGQPVGGGFFTLVNHGAEPDRLVSITSPVSGEMQMHEMSLQDDVMQMRKLPDGIPVPPGATVRLETGGMHVMFMRIAAPFREGESIPATLTFEKAGVVEVEFEVEAFRSGSAAGAGHKAH